MTTSGVDKTHAANLKGENQSLEEHFNDLPRDNKYMNKLHSLLSKWAERKFTASYRYNTRDLVVGLAVEVEKLVQERTEAVLAHECAKARLEGIRAKDAYISAGGEEPYYIVGQKWVDENITARIAELKEGEPTS